MLMARCVSGKCVVPISAAQGTDIDRVTGCIDQRHNKELHAD